MRALTQCDVTQVSGAFGLGDIGGAAGAAIMTDAAMGALDGSIAGPVGVVAGAVIGAGLGFLGGAIIGSMF